MHDDRMSLTVRDVLQLDVICRGKPEVVAGLSGLHRLIRWVHIADIREVAPLLKGGELLLTSGLGIGTDAEQQREWVKQLADRKIAGIVLSLGWAFRETPAAAISEADRLGLPFVVLHEAIPFVEVTERLHSLIVDHQVSLLRKAEQMGQEFTELVLHGAPIRDVVESLARLVTNPVVLEDEQGRLVEFADYPGGDADIASGWKEHSRAGHQNGPALQLAVEDGRPGCAWTVIPLREQAWGRLHVLLFGPFDEIDRVAVDRAAVAISLSLVSQEDEGRATDQAEAALVGEVIRGDVTSDHELVSRAAALGRSFEGLRLVALSADVDGFRSHLDRHGLRETQIQRLKTRMREAVGQSIREAGCGGLSSVESDEVVAIVGVRAEENLRARLDAIGSRIEAALARVADGLSATVGSGREAGSVAELPRSFREAREAVRYGKLAGIAPRAMIHFDDLGVDLLLVSLPDQQVLRRFVEAELGPLLEWDAGRGTPLLPTLQAYLAHGRNKAGAARALRVNRRSLYHRLDRISKLLGRDLESPEAATRLTVALRGLAIIQRGEGP